MSPDGAGRAPDIGVRALFFQIRLSAQGRRRRVVAAWAVAASALSVALGLAPAPANAACAPDPAASGDTVTCSGNTPGGFQAGGGVDNLTVNVLQGATVGDAGGAIRVGESLRGMRGVLTGVPTFEGAALPAPSAAHDAG